MLTSISPVRHRSSLALLATLAILALAACGGSADTPVDPNGGNPGGGNPGGGTPIAVTGVTALAVSNSSISVTFATRAGDTKYDLERAEGTGGTFASVRVVDAPATAATVTITDVGLKAGTLYRYRIKTLIGTATSNPSAEVSATTLSNIPTGNADVTTDITSNRTFFAETTYTLKGFIHVTNGATLTIRPGTVIKGDFATVGSSLFIMRGAHIDAVGAVNTPIVFTSSRAAGSRQPGDWGGIVIVGNALINRTGSVPVEGTGTDGTAIAGGKNYQVLYSGGNTPTDNSGTMSYVRVEFAGYAPSADNELNSFTFAAVGSGTRVSYLQSMASLDDAFEFFGGGLDGDHLVAYETGDDMFDFSEGFSGRLQYLIGLNTVALTPRTGAGALSADITGIESDGCFGSGCDAGFNQQPLTIPLVANFTLVGCGNASTCGGVTGGVGLSLRRGTGGYFVNGIIARFPTGGISLRDRETFTRGGEVQTPNILQSDILVRNIYFTEIGQTIFQGNTGSPSVQFALDLPSNGLINGFAIVSSLFTTFPTPLTAPVGTAGLDWTPSATAASNTGGMNPLLGKMTAKGGTFVTGTSYMGAADPNGPKWWAGWTTYVRN
jgi:hypothetical protein